MSWTRLMKRTAKISVKAHIFITAFFTVGAINIITPKTKPVNAIVKSTVPKIVIVSILFNFNYYCSRLGIAPKKPIIDYIKDFKLLRDRLTLIKLFSFLKQFK